MSLSDDVKALEADLSAERKHRRDLDNRIEEIREVLQRYNDSSVKAWGRTLEKIGRLVGVEVKS